MKRFRISAALAMTGLLALVGCGSEPAADVPDPRPDWSRFVVDGITPLMTPATVEGALVARGYRQRPCGSDDPPVDPRALYRSDTLVCFEASERNSDVTLYFLETIEGRRLATANFSEFRSWRLDRGEGRPRALAFEQRLITRFGKPDLATGDPEIRMRYWFVPGGSPSLQDNIQTVITPYSGRNISLTSFWAYGHQRALEAATAQPPASPPAVR
jgi:hypothetical protein